ncbi:MAG: nuclear transport factor 2 family protein [Candidatus Thiodiazotropha sp.]
MKISQNLLTSDSWSEQETANVKTISEFVQALMIGHEADKVISQYDNSDYTQHNRNIPDGLTGIADFVRNFAKQFPDFTYDVKKIIADGDYVVFHSHATIKKSHRGNDKKGMNITDVWRLDDGKIVEHWDSIQAIDLSMRIYALLNGGKIRNANGVF